MQPPEQLPWLEEIGYAVDADMSLIEKGKRPFVDGLHRVMDARCQALHHHWDREPWQQMMFVFTGTDRLNHYLWEDYEDETSEFHQAFLDFYHEVDVQIGRILERLSDDTVIAAVSDHGFARQRKSINLNCLLAEAGLLSLKEICEGRRTSTCCLKQKPLPWIPVGSICIAPAVILAARCSRKRPRKYCSL